MTVQSLVAVYQYNSLTTCVQDHNDRGGMFRPSDQPVDGVSTVTREQVGGRGRHHLRPSHHVCWWSLTILTETSVITPIPINDLVLPRSYIEMSWKTFTYHYSIHQSCLLYLTLFCFF